MSAVTEPRETPVVAPASSGTTSLRWAGLVWNMKWVSLFLLVVQTTSLVTTIRYSVTTAGPRYLATTAVFWMEFVKAAAALLVVFAQCDARPQVWANTVVTEVLLARDELAKLAVPSLIYTAQNNILYLAIANLDAPTYQVVYNAKILTTGLFSVALLGRRLTRVQWASLLLLMVGVSLAQYTPNQPAAAAAAEGNRALGLFLVATACVTSGFAGVYFEKVLKSSRTSLWVRNLQMSVTSLPLALLGVWWYDGASVAAHGFNYGYTPVVWQIVLNQALGGLLVAVVVKYADNLLKSFAAAISIVTSCLLASAFFDFAITVYFVVGATLVLLASYVYSAPAETMAPYLPTLLKEGASPTLPQ